MEYNISFYKEVYNLVETFKEQNKDNYSPNQLRNLAYQKVIDKYKEEYPSLINRGNKYVGEWLTRYRRKTGIINTNVKKYTTENKYISYGIIFSTLKFINPFTTKENFVLTLPGTENNFRFEKLLLRKFNNITTIDCIEKNKKNLSKLLTLEIPHKIKLYPKTILLEEFIKNVPSNWYNFIWADFCSVSRFNDFENIVYKAIKTNGIFAITETQRQHQEMIRYRFNPNKEKFENLIDYTYQPSNMILKIYKIIK